MSDFKVTAHADPEVIAAIEQLARRSTREDAALSTYMKSVDGEAVVIVVAIGTSVGGMLVTCVDALRKHVEQTIARAAEKETRH